jgi:hypothetical protein
VEAKEERMTDRLDLAAKERTLDVLLDRLDERRRMSEADEGAESIALCDETAAAAIELCEELAAEMERRAEELAREESDG